MFFWDSIGGVQYIIKTRLSNVMSNLKGARDCLNNGSEPMPMPMQFEDFAVKKVFLIRAYFCEKILELV